MESAIALAGGINYPVGVGGSTDPYGATRRAVLACGQWPSAAIVGKVVMIKPNLVAPQPSTSGATTDPQVVRALVDLCLAAGAAQIFICEGGAGAQPANFSACGYDFFNAYDTRVRLLDFGTQSYASVAVPGGMVLQSLYLPAPAIQPNVFFISAAKLKCHTTTVVSLSMKNLFGLATPAQYYIPKQLTRQDLHDRGPDEAIVDINIARPVDFAVIDGIWGMQGNGPLWGTPIQVNTVLAGPNALAVDRTGLALMQIAQTAVPHLAYASSRGLGPPDIGAITILGDPLHPMPFTPAQTAPTAWRPSVTPASLSLSAGQYATISYRLLQTCYLNVDIVQDSDAAPGMKVIRTLHNWIVAPSGVSAVRWYGRDNSFAAVTPGPYLARIGTSNGKQVARASSRLMVTA